jgi:hypothetical protein
MQGVVDTAADGLWRLVFSVAFFCLLFLAAQKSERLPGRPRQLTRHGDQPKQPPAEQKN